ncbi:hypothetical protein DXG01_016262 [Tephrocybe rancida]|nr:hypothetical protein DXG01_016262 [Tephrocybe rancida]
MDSMHALDLCLFANHLHKLFKIDIDTLVGGDGLLEPLPPASKLLDHNDQKSKDCWELIRQNPPNLVDGLTSFHCKVLYTVCCENNIKGPGHSIIVGTQWVLVVNISHWWGNPEFDPIKLPVKPMDDGHQDTLAPEEDSNGDGNGNGNNEGDSNIINAEDNATIAAPATTATLPQAENIDVHKAKCVLQKLLVASTYTMEEKDKFYKATPAEIYMYLCDLVGIGLPDLPRMSRLYKNAVYKRLTESIDAEDSVTQQALLLFISPENFGRIVLAKDVMEAIWADIWETQLPTWI